MNRARRLLACALLLACLGATHPAVTLEVQVERSSFDLLDPLSVTVQVWNHTKARETLHFPHTDEYAIDVLDGETILSTTLVSPQPAGVAHARAFLPGVTRLAIYEFNVEGADRSIPVPGLYRLRVRLLDDENTASLERPLRFAAPLEISALAKTGTQVVTIEGTLAPDRLSLTDGTASVALTHRLMNMTAGSTVVVRGAMTITPSRTKAFEPTVWGLLSSTK